MAFNPARATLLCMVVATSACDFSVDPFAGMIIARSTTQITAIAGARVLPRPSVIVKSRHGVPLEGVAVRFRVTGGGGTVSGETVKTDSAGIATVSDWILGAQPGVNTLTAEAGSLTGSPITFTAKAVLPLLGGTALNTEYYHTLQYGPLWCDYGGELIICEYRHEHDAPGYGNSKDDVVWNGLGSTVTFFAPFGMDGVSATQPESDPAARARYVGYTQDGVQAGSAWALAPGTYACYISNNFYWGYPGDNLLHQTDCKSVSYLREYGRAGSFDSQVDLWNAVQEIRCEFLPTRPGHPIYCALGGRRAAGVAITSVDFSMAGGDVCGGQGTSTEGGVIVGFSDPGDCDPYAVYQLRPTSLNGYAAVTMNCVDNNFQPANCDALFVLKHNR